MARLEDRLATIEARADLLARLVAFNVVLSVFILLNVVAVLLLRTRVPLP